MPLHNRILVVDDHPTNLAVLEELLGETYPLTLATSGEAALALAKEITPALILLDVMMPGIDGYETCRRLRALPLRQPPKILMVSAKAMVAERLRGYDAGADDYVTKPFDPQELLAKVRVYLQLRSSEEVDQLKSQMLTLLNHEMRTPLNGLMAPLQLLRTDAAMAAEERQLLLEMAAHSATRLERLCEKVTTLSAMHAGHWDLQCVTVDLREVVRSALEAVTAEAAARRVTLIADLPEAALACCDLHQMREVLLTLLDNAIRVSPPGGPVYVQVAREAAHGTVRVTDCGAGIDPAYLPYVFEAFIPADLAHHTAGLNVSLAIAQQITHAHHGTIDVGSTSETGTTFTVRLPQAPACNHEAMPPGRRVPGPMDDAEHRREVVHSPGSSGSTMAHCSSVRSEGYCLRGWSC
jgi:signal transduction histidine kinase